MRALLSLSTITLSAVVLLAACTDDRSATAPGTGRAPSAVADVAPSASVAAQAGGKPTTPAFTTISTVVGPTQTIFGYPGNQGATSTATCPAGSVAIGGAYSVTNGFKDLRITSSKPNATQTAWQVSAGWYGDDFNGTNMGTFTATAICIK
jgi:hypothetical protein